MLLGLNNVSPSVYRIKQHEACFWPLCSVCIMPVLPHIDSLRSKRRARHRTSAADSTLASIAIADNQPAAATVFAVRVVIVR